ncbi:MAG TPA: C40 family peptidase [Jatrophihabitans sp.]|nr:C40 family peptidase [Jatrophihabitans sp.]
MASTRVTRLARTIVSSLLVVGTLLAAPLAAHAIPRAEGPTPTTPAQVQAKLAVLAKTSEQLAEQYNRAQLDVAAAEQAVVSANQAADLAQAHLVQVQQILARSVSAQYKAASFSRTVALLASTSSEGYLETVQTMGLLTEHESQVAAMAATAIAAANAATTKAQAAVTTAAARKAALAKRRQALNAEVRKYKTLLATLTAAARARYFTPVTPAPAQVQRAFSTIPLGAAKGAAGAIAAARAELGKPYAWGASGPDAFDCSGLTAWAWGAAGVSLPHNAAAQQGMGTPVNQSDLQPGDLVFFGSPAYHVALYIGQGLVIHAPTTGDVVKIVPLSSIGDYSGATRVG